VRPDRLGGGHPAQILHDHPDLGSTYTFTTPFVACMGLIAKNLTRDEYRRPTLATLDVSAEFGVLGRSGPEDLAEQVAQRVDIATWLAAFREPLEQLLEELERRARIDHSAQSWAMLLWIARDDPQRKYLEDRFPFVSELPAFPSDRELHEHMIKMGHRARPKNLRNKERARLLQLAERRGGAQLREAWEHVLEQLAAPRGGGV
jgi:hypothetical protein